MAIIFEYPSLLLAFTLLLISIIKWGNNPFKKSSKLGPKLLPGPSPWPIVGNLPELYMNKPPFSWFDRVMKELHTDVACFRLGSVHVIVVNSPEIARELFHNNDDQLASRPLTVVTEHSSRGYLSMALSPSGPQWKKMRKMYTTELINPARHRWLLDKRNQEADNYVSFMLHQCNSNGFIVDVRTTLRHYAINFVRRLLFNKRNFGKGGKGGGPGEEEKEHVNAIFTILRHLYAFCVSDYLPWLRVLDLQGHEKAVKEALGVVNKYHDPIIEERIMRRRINSEKQEPQDLLDVMISLEDATGRPLLSEEEIKAQCIELFFGVDSPTVVLEWALAKMINKPEVRQKAVDELDKVVGKGRLVQESDIPSLNYIKACIRESFRLHPITPFNLPRVATSDIAVGNNYFIPKGSHVLLGRRGLGRNPKVWEDPLEFKPERHFNADQSNKVELMEPELRFLTFSAGKRACPAIALGTAFSVTALGRILQGFDWSVPPNEEKIDVAEAPHIGFEMAKPLYAHAKPRLPATTYPIII